MRRQRDWSLALATPRLRSVAALHRTESFRRTASVLNQNQPDGVIGEHVDTHPDCLLWLGLQTSPPSHHRLSLEEYPCSLKHWLPLYCTDLSYGTPLPVVSYMPRPICLEVFHLS